MMKCWRSLLPPLAIFALALTVRVVYNLTVAAKYVPTHDAQIYQNIALHLLNEHCYCDYPYTSIISRAPLWPVLIAAIYAIFGPQNESARLFLSVVGSGTCLLIFFFARHLFSLRMGLLAGAIAAIYPELFIYDGWLYSESLYIFLTLAFCYLLYRLPHIVKRHQRRNWWAWALCGLLLALISLTRPNGLALLGLFMLWALIMGWTRMLAWRSLIIGCAITLPLSLLIIAPWTFHNYQVSHTFVPIASGDGTVLLGSYNDLVLSKPNYIGAWISPSTSAPKLAHSYPSICSASCEIQREENYKNQAITWIKAHPNQLPFLLGMHFVNTWRPDTQEADLPTGRFGALGSTQFVRVLMLYFPPVIFVLAIPGLFISWRFKQHLIAAYGMIALTLGLALVFYGSPRFRAPIEPLLILLAVATIWWLTERRSQSSMSHHNPEIGP